MRTMTIRKSIAVGAVASLAMFTAACGTDQEPTDTTAGDSDSETTEPTEEEPTEEEPTEDPGNAGGTGDPFANLVGEGCAGYAEANPEGPASVEGMAQEPVGSAAAGNPLLKTLVAAVTGGVNPDVDLLGALNDPQATYTVFAPVDEAFAAIPKKTLNTLAKEPQGTTLSSILTYHVLTERVEPTDLEGSYTTLNEEDLMVSGGPDTLEINGESSVICGGVQTANATVYLIDSVLTPPSIAQAR